MPTLGRVLYFYPTTAAAVTSTTDTTTTTTTTTATTAGWTTLYTTPATSFADAIVGAVAAGVTFTTITARRKQAE